MSTLSPNQYTAPRGRIACVGMGMTLGSHLTPLARSHIEQADVVFAALSDPLVEAWLEQMNANVRSLQPYYGNGTDKPRMQTYREWADLMMDEVRAGRSVCAVFYGHPGIFAWTPHEVIRRAREEGYEAVMEPGISSEDCLYADVGFDPANGCQHYEASQMVFCNVPINSAAYLVLWQAGLVGDISSKRFTTGPEYRQVLVDVLAAEYPPQHEIIIYRGATLPIEQPTIRRIALRDLSKVDVRPDETVVIPPARQYTPNRVARARLKALDAAWQQELCTTNEKPQENQHA
ncbi:SAM-dependent methyltransferase [Oleiagrimonas sp. C23AA]|uniref:SAM-dependent methyltransferase n=1 Tax=Oleiagrimonas sp. C23AA TaxID=2719047 RepID=UPI0014226736|nr:SAM-dependent methyltransferase [Oleiagrimonas sp. C23AA]NII09846.1 hypothetical protein [Oleiagrimonas sp. C23AA]